MRSSIHSISALALAATLVIVALTPVRGSAAKPDAGSGEALVVIVAPNAGFSDLPLAMLRRVFRGEPTDVAGRRLVPFNYAPEHATRKLFDALVLDMNPEEVGRYWVDRRIRGQGMPPRTVPSPAVARAVVVKLPGAIAYVPASELDASVRALRIGYKAHGEPDYPLRAPSR